jgi:hypothetical protein
MFGNWEEKIALLKEHKRVHGHCRSMNLDQSLAQWACQVRTYPNWLTREQEVGQLKELEFVFHPNEAKWKKYINDLIEFKEAHGHFDIPWSYKDNRSLARWVQSIRHNANWNLTCARIAELDELGFQHGRDKSTGS